MSIKNFFKQQFQLRRFLLEHDVVSDFYLSCFQRNLSTAPLLIIRTIIFIGCLCILIASLVLTPTFMQLKYWMIFMTHWGLILNTIAAGFGMLVSIMATIKSPLEIKTGLPWYVKAYWVTFNLATPVAFFITVFYWTFLTEIEQDFAVNETLDIFIHAVNSALMCALLISSRQPASFLHFYMPIGFAIVYLIFSYIYYAVDGTDGFGNHAIYPMIDWEMPGLTIGISVLSAVVIVILHGVVVVLSALRDIISGRLEKESTYDVHPSYL